MPKYLICFRVETIENGSIEVEAESAQAASEAFYRGKYGDARRADRLTVEDSEETITEIQGPDGSSFFPA